MPYSADRARETTTTTGTGTVSLAGTATGYQTLVAAVGSGAVVHYCITSRVTTEWEVGIGTVTDASPDTLSRTTILASSNSGSAVAFTAGTKDVFITQPAKRLGVGAGGFEASTSGSGSPNVLSALESGAVYSNEGATAKAFFTLPTAEAGLLYTFNVQDTDGLRVTAAAGDTIRFAATVSSVAGYIESTTRGDSITLYAINATEWVAVAIVGAGWGAA